MDEVLARINQRFDAIDRRFDAVDPQFIELRADISALQRQITMIDWGVAGAFLAQFVAFIVTRT
jgi:hypothetical protein